MTVLEDVRQLQQAVAAVEKLGQENREKVTRTEEQLNGDRGLSAALDQLAREVQSLRRAAYWLAALIVASSIGFAFSVLTFLQ